MNNELPPLKRHRVNLDVAPGFEMKLKLLGAKWGVKTNVAAQRAVDQALARKWADDEKEMLKTLVSRVEELTQNLLP